MFYAFGDIPYRTEQEVYKFIKSKNGFFVLPEGFFSSLEPECTSKFMRLTSDGKKIMAGGERNNVISEKNHSIVNPILFLDGKESILRHDERRYPI